MTNKKHFNEEGINGTGEGVVNVNSQDFIGLREAVIRHARKQTTEQKIKFGLLSLRYQMEHYVTEAKTKRVVEAGEFLKRYLELINVKNKYFAKYIGIEESNLSSIINGRRKINIDLAFKLGRIFDLSPNLWLQIQSKNELLKVEDSRKADYNKFSLDELLNKAG